MTQEELASSCNGTLCVRLPSNAAIHAAYTSDMLSDVMAHAPENSALITIQNHINTIAVSTLAGIEIVVVCHNRDIPADMLKSAEAEGVGIVTTPLSQFEASCAIGLALSRESKNNG